MEKQSYGIWPNQGQVTDDQGNPVPDISFYTTGALPRAFFKKSGTFSLVVSTRDTVAQVDTFRCLAVTCVGPEANYPDPIVWEMKDRYANFFLPQCGPGGATNVHPYARVIYPSMYPNIDMQIYSGESGQKLAFVINPGGDPKQIALQFQGQDSMMTDIYGNLKLMLAGKWVVLPQAVAYQVDGQGNIITVNWTAHFQAYNNVGKAFLDFGAYDHNKPLIFVIGPPPALGGQTYDEPGLCWSTFYGAEQYDYPKDVKADNDGNVYVAGRTESGWNHFPHVNGTSTNAHGTSVATLTKFSPAHVLQWTIFQGGNTGANSMSQGVAVAIKNDPTRVYMVGTTDADDFLTSPLTGAYNDGSNNNTTTKGFVARYNGDNGLLQWSTYIGTQNVQVQAIDVTQDNARIAISGITQGSLPLGNLLPDMGGYQFDTYHGAGDAFVALFNPSDNVQWSAFYGGANIEDRALVSCGDGVIDLAGNTRSGELPVVGSSPAFTEAYHGGVDMYIAQFSYGGNFLWSTYLGGPGDESLAPKGMTVSKDLYLTGTSGTLPALVPGNGWSDITPTNVGLNGFIARFQHLTNAPLWISYLGGWSNASPWCIDVSSSRVTVGGYTNDPNFQPTPWLGFYYQPGYVQDNGGGMEDGFILSFSDQQDPLWATLIGGQGSGLNVPENVTAVHDMGDGTIYATGYTSQQYGTVANPFPMDGVLDADMFFNPLYNYDGLTGGYSDGFVTEFCNEMTTGIAEDSPASDNRLHVAWSPAGKCTLLGLADGPHQLRVYDAEGRLILHRSVRSTGGRSEAVSLATTGTALYMLVVDARLTGRLVPVH